MKKQKKEYNSGKIVKLWHLLVELHQTNPEYFSTPDYLRAIVAQRWTLLDQKEICPNCKASMVQYNPKIDFFDAMLLKAMSEAVKEKLEKGVSFTEANQVHVQSLNNADYTTKSRTTKCRQLGLVAKVMVDGVHDQQAGWVITHRGWKFLKNDPIPCQVTTFRNEIIDRSDELVTIVGLLNTEKRTVEYDPRSWIEYGELTEGVL